MFVLGNFLFALARIMDILLQIAYWALLIRAILSWVSPDPYNPIVRTLHALTEPLLAPIRRRLPFGWRLGVDISPLIAFLLLVFLQVFLVRTIQDIALRLR